MGLCFYFFNLTSGFLTARADGLFPALQTLQLWYFCHSVLLKTFPSQASVTSPSLGSPLQLPFCSQMHISKLLFWALLKIGVWVCCLVSRDGLHAETCSSRLGVAFIHSSSHLVKTSEAPGVPAPPLAPPAPSVPFYISTHRPSKSICWNSLDHKALFLKQIWAINHFKLYNWLKNYSEGRIGRAWWLIRCKVTKGRNQELS